MEKVTGELLGGGEGSWTSIILLLSLPFTGWVVELKRQGSIEVGGRLEGSRPGLQLLQFGVRHQPVHSEAPVYLTPSWVPQAAAMPRMLRSGLPGQKPFPYSHWGNPSQVSLEPFKGSL